MTSDKVIGRTSPIGNPIVAIGAIFKNEHPYILEWLAFHRILGIDRFFIADNNSDDGTTELLSALATAGLIDYIPFPGSPDRPPQLDAYREILAKHSCNADWIAFIDADEFLVPTDGAKTLSPFFSEIDSAENIGCVVINWAVYGSSGHTEASDDLTIERFTKRGEDQWIKNYHYKSLVRTAAFPVTAGNPHAFNIKEPYSEVYPTGEKVEYHNQLGRGLSKSIVWHKVRLNHYVVRSKQEFFQRKGPRGSATVLNRIKAENYFELHDKNEVTDIVDTWLIEATKSEIKNIKMILLNQSIDIGKKIIRSNFDDNEKKNHKF